MMSKRQYYLIKLAEECNEVAQRALKQAQFGAKEVQADSPSETKIKEKNSDRLLAEVIDLKTVLVMLEILGELRIASADELKKRSGEKANKLTKYLRYSQALGMVEPDDLYDRPVQ